jgi:acyl-CoA thioesterase
LTSTQLNAFTWLTLFAVHSVSANWSGLERVGPVTHPAAGLAAQAMFAGDVVSQSLGMGLLAAGEGTAVVRMRITEQMVNGHAIAHGGYLFMLADTAFGYACNSCGPATVAAGADITFVSSARLGDELIATATERIRYGRNGVYDVTVRRGGDVIAEFRGRSRIIGPHH